MSLEMFLHVILSDESFTASITREWLFARMEAEVPPQIGLVVELLRTPLALVRLLARVLLQVLLVLRLSRKSLPTLGALERLNARVKALVMLRQIARLVEMLIALVALVYLFVAVIGIGSIRIGAIDAGADELLLEDLWSPSLHVSHVRIDIQVKILLRPHHVVVALVIFLLLRELTRRERLLILNFVLLGDHTFRTRLYRRRVYMQHFVRRWRTVHVKVRSGRIEGFLRSILRSWPPHVNGLRLSFYYVCR